jgi:type III pantothenate kinase
MITVIDIGNTNIHVGLYAKQKLRKKLVYPTRKGVREPAFIETVRGNVPTAVAIASVVPRMTKRFASFFKKHFGMSVFRVSSRVETHLSYDYYKPQTLGADRIANVVGGLAHYRRNLIIIDFGTAITLDVVLRDSHYLGGLICPGTRTMAEALSRHTALLRKVVVDAPPRLIGRSTEECIQSGIFTGTAAMVQGLIERVKGTCRRRFYCIATGGGGVLISRHIPGIDTYDPHLCLFGTLMTYRYNAKKK